ncbi:MAG TPA: hypothetical protein VD758_00095, partial [Gemmatimonadaceae bacterium]|nr:hypothetical protein [Gemmatimonadaceae bacterium]
VMMAKGDTLLAPPDSERIVVDAAPTKPIPAESVRILNERESLATAKPVVALAARPAPARTAPVKQTVKESAVVRASETVVASTTPTPMAAKRRSVEVRDEVKPAERSARTRGIVSAGSSLSLVTGQRVCTYAANPGDTFEAVLLEPVRGTNGVVIPKGSFAVAEITSLGEWGAGIGVRVKSVRFKGHTYPLSSDVGYVALERANSKGAVCIPERGRIDTSLTHPLTVVAYN